MVWQNQAFFVRAGLSNLKVLDRDEQYHDVNPDFLLQILCTFSLHLSNMFHFVFCRLDCHNRELQGLLMIYMMVKRNIVSAPEAQELCQSC